jgi:hypothetical protein
MNAYETLIRATLDHFLSTGAWPQTKRMQSRLRHLGNLAKLASEIGYDRFICEEGADGVCKLTLKALASFQEAEPDIQNYLFAIRTLADRYINSETIGSIPATHLVEDLNLSDAEVRRVLELIYITPSMIWTGASGSPANANLTITPSSHVWYFEHVQTLDEFYSTLARAEQDLRETERGRFVAFIPADAPEFAPTEEASVRARDFVDRSRLRELRAIENSPFDLRRLIAYCEELNTCAANDCHFATIMLTRAIIDHIPPIFNAANFDEVANNYAGSKSFKTSIKHLANSARSIANAHLHEQIRKKEILANPTQVDFAPAMDVLLAEIVRILS